MRALMPNEMKAANLGWQGRAPFTDLVVHSQVARHLIAGYQSDYNVHPEPITVLIQGGAGYE